MVETNKYQIHDLVWVFTETDAWVPGVVARSIGDSVLVYAKERQINVVFHEYEDPSAVIQMRTENMGLHEDQLTKGMQLCEPALFDTLSTRFIRDKRIYSLIGPVLVAMNPYKVLDIYGKKQRDLATENRIKFAHPYGVMAEAMYNMMNEHKDQTIVIGGESGAGKTETAKKLVEYSLSLTGEGNAPPLADSNPVMESFGNAKTVRNNNSSRFGKFMKIYYNDNSSIVGASMETFMLERSRIVTLMPEERNYHIFYQLLAGANSSIKADLELTSPKDYYYLNQSKCTSIIDVDDNNDFYETSLCLQVFGASDDMLFDIYSLLAAILHLGNITFEEGGDDSAIISNTGLRALSTAARLLGVEEADLSVSLTQREIIIRGDRIMKYCNIDEAAVSRDGLAKQLYDQLFQVVVDLVRDRLQTHVDDSNTKNNYKFIGVLDIFGFEIFDINSLEQFNINYCNEKLHGYFNSIIFEREVKFYKEEGVSTEGMQYSDNAGCIGLIENRMGIMNIMDEECALGDMANIHSFVRKLDKSFGKGKPHASSYFSTHKIKKNVFAVDHFASPVVYDATEFLSKNRERLRDEHSRILIHSNVEFISTMVYNAYVAQEHESAAGSPSNKRKSSSNSMSLSGKFKIQLNSLVNTLKNSETQFIRCVKPNSTKSSFKVEPQLVLDQLKSNGIVDLVKVLRLGYSHRVSHETFVRRYYIVMGASSPLDCAQGRGHGDNETVQFAFGAYNLLNSIQEKGIWDNTSFALGRTMVFIRDAETQNDLDKVRYNEVMRFIVLIQTQTRMLLAKLKVEKKREAIREFERQAFDRAVKVQARVRGMSVRRQMGALHLVVRLRGALSRRDASAALQLCAAIHESAHITRIRGDKASADNMEDVALRGRTMSRLLQSQDTYLDRIRTAVEKENAVALNYLLPLAADLALLGHPFVIEAKKELLRLYFVRNLKVCIVEYLETGEQHANNIFDILAIAREEGVDGELLNLIDETANFLNEMHTVRLKLRLAVELVDTRRMKILLLKCRGIREHHSADGNLSKFAEAEVTAASSLLRLIEMERQLQPDSPTAAGVPLLVKDIRKICELLNEERRDEDYLDTSDDGNNLDLRSPEELFIALKEACDKLNCKITPADAVRYFKWTKVLCTWTYSPVSTGNYFGLDMQKVTGSTPSTSIKSPTRHTPQKAEGKSIPDSATHLYAIPAVDTQDSKPSRRVSLVTLRRYQARQEQEKNESYDMNKSQPLSPSIKSGKARVARTQKNKPPKPFIKTDISSNRRVSFIFKGSLRSETDDNDRALLKKEEKERKLAEMKMEKLLDSSRKALKSSKDLRDAYAARDIKKVWSAHTQGSALDRSPPPLSSGTRFDYA